MRRNEEMNELEKMSARLMTSEEASFSFDQLNFYDLINVIMGRISENKLKELIPKANTSQEEEEAELPEPKRLRFEKSGNMVLNVQRLTNSQGSKQKNTIVQKEPESNLEKSLNDKLKGISWKQKSKS